MWSLGQVEELREVIIELEQADSCDTLAEYTFEEIYGHSKTRVNEVILDKEKAINKINQILENEYVVIIEISNGRNMGVFFSLFHAFILFKGRNYPIILQSYANAYCGKISEWPNWQSDLTDILFNDLYGRVDAWNKAFDVDIDINLLISQKEAELDVVIYRPIEKIYNPVNEKQYRKVVELIYNLNYDPIFWFELMMEYHGKPRRVDLLIGNGFYFCDFEIYSFILIVYLNEVYLLHKINEKAMKVLKYNREKFDVLFLNNSEKLIPNKNLSATAPQPKYVYYWHIIPSNTLL